MFLAFLWLRGPSLDDDENFWRRIILKHKDFQKFFFLNLTLVEPKTKNLVIAAPYLSACSFIVSVKKYQRDQWTPKLPHLKYTRNYYLLTRSTFTFFARAILKWDINKRKREQSEKCVEQYLHSEWRSGRNKVELKFIRIEQIAEQTGGFKLTISLDNGAVLHFPFSVVGVSFKTTWKI